jgi:amino acid transporter
VDIPVLIGGIVRFALGIVGSLFLLMFIYGGFLWMTAGGSGDRTKKAKNTIVNAVLGMAIILLSYTIISFVIEIASRVQK